MIRNRILLKALSVFFAVEVLVTGVLPSVTFALTAGPTAPEATSFEPVDTTDMVNLATGDLAYNIPLLEVPGPSGGYPLSLSYHAGIQPNEEASWTGLGWTLNPGAITRNVNGFADDHSNLENFSRFYWDGGERRTYSAGVSVGIAGTLASVSAGLSYSQDTYQGKGVGVYVGLGSQLTKASPVGIGFTMGVDPYGGPYASAGFNLSAPIGKSEKTGVGLSTGIGLTTNFQNMGFYASGGVSGLSGSGNTSALGATISSGSNGISGNISIAGATFESNASNSGRVSSTSDNFDIPIPILPAVWFSIGYNYQRYWIDETDNFKVNGSLYYPDKGEVELTKAYFDENAFDTYSLLDPNLEGGVVDNPDPDKVLGGSFPGFDNYTVHAQGIFGDMQPYYFQKHLYKRNNYYIDSEGEKDYQTFQYDLAQSNSDVDDFRAEFRFINDFSNRFEYTPSTIDYSASPLGDPDQIPFDYNFQNGSDLKTGETGGGTYTTNQVQGSRHINWFTNAEILAQDIRVTSSGFINTVSSGFNRSTPNDLTDDSNIGGFVITNESGVKYHFALPAYSFAEYAYSENKTGTETFNEFNKPGKYAYTWYLTAVTGPDYVDRGATGPGDGILNGYDWGYWVEFEYGKWTDEYGWRNPSQGMASDLDDDFQNFSEGKKELYYLDAIRTKSHTALFFKDIRHDAKGSLYLQRNINFDGGTASEAIVAQTKEGGFIPSDVQCKCRHYIGAGSPLPSVLDEGILNYTALPTSTLKLSTIILVANDKLAQESLSKEFGSEYSQSNTFNWTIQQEDQPGSDGCDFSPFDKNHHLYQNIYDVYDLSQDNQIVQNALRVIEFETDYSLVPGTSNSFDYNLVKSQSPSTVDDEYPKYGKLTLNALKFKGNSSGDNLLPPMLFRYDLSNPLTGSGQLVKETSGDYRLESESTDLQPGDLIRFEIIQDGIEVTHHATVLSVTGSAHALRILNKPSIMSQSIIWQVTKNPPYNRDAYDLWGLYKSDFDSEYEGDENIARRVTVASSKSLDVWSLRTVKTVTGAEITMNYESDSFVKPALSHSSELIIRNVIKKNSNTSWITLATDFPHMDRILAEGMELNYFIFFALLFTGSVGGVGLKTALPRMNSGTMEVQSVFKEGDYWVISTESDLEQFYEVPPDQMGVDYHKSIFIAGNISTQNAVINYGGGLRVKDISIELFDKTVTTNYEYEGLSDAVNSTSGTTSYEPAGIDNVLFYFPDVTDADAEYFTGNTIEGNKKVYKKEFYRGFEEILLNSRVVPPPGVLYEYVKVSETVTTGTETMQGANYSLYQFEVYNKGMVGIDYQSDDQEFFATKNYDGFVSYDKKETRNVILKDYTSRIGALKNITLYHTLSGQKISETINHYLHDAIDPQLLTGENDPDLNDDLEANIEHYEPELNARFGNQGVIHETFTDARFMKPSTGDFVLQGVISKRERFPSIQTGQTNINYKTGIQSTSTTLAFDFYSGQPTKTLSKDGYGNAFIIEITPAHEKYQMMGQAASGGKNMLTQEAALFTYKVDPIDINSIEGLAGASVQTWSDETSTLKPDQTTDTQPGIWRKRANYVYMGNPYAITDNSGLFQLPDHTLPAFNAWDMSDPTPPGWQKNGEITLYDVNSHALSALDINDIYSASKFSSDQFHVLATASNSRYEEFAYSGAEDRTLAGGLFGGGVQIAEGIEVFRQNVSDNLTTHTGQKALALSVTGDKAFQFAFNTLPDRKYQASVWVNSSVGSLFYRLGAGTPQSSAAPSASKKSGSWYLLNIEIPSAPESTSLEVWCETVGGTCHFDDFRVSPHDASMVSYVYNEWGELSHILDNNNLYTHYQYDAAGRLVETYKESFGSGVVKTGEVIYNYKNSSN